MPAVIVNEDRCQCSQVCVTACPYDAIGLISNDRGRAVAHIYENCIDCLLCISACPQQAIMLVSTYGLSAELEVYNGVWVVVADTSVKAQQLVTQAAKLAQTLHAPTGVILLGADSQCEVLMTAGATTVVPLAAVASDRQAYLADDLLQFVDERQPEALLFADQALVRDLARQLAFRLQIDVLTSIHDVASELRERRLCFQRSVLDQQVHTAIAIDTRPLLAVV